jgi:hypothetical protein
MKFFIFSQYITMPGCGIFDINPAAILNVNVFRSKRGTGSREQGTGSRNWVLSS